MFTSMTIKRNLKITNEIIIYCDYLDYLWKKAC